MEQAYSPTNMVSPYVYIDNNESPNFLYAIPIIGLLVKLVMLIPAFIFLCILSLISFVLSCIVNPFVVLATGKYYPSAYNWLVYTAKYQTKLILFASGLSDNYPGFDDQFKDPSLQVIIDYPTQINRLWAFPILGLMVRGILIIPYALFIAVMYYAAMIGAAFVGTYFVLFNKKYPTSIQEMVLNFLNLGLRANCYVMGLNDNKVYPDFNIRITHKEVEYILIVLGVLYLIFNHK